MSQITVEIGKFYWVEINAVRMQVVVKGHNTIKGWWKCLTIPVGTALFEHETSFKAEADGKPC